jgi:L-fuconolactonase
MTAVIDSHLHLWDPGRIHYPWLAGAGTLNRAFGPADFPTGGRRIDAAVFVEAGCAADQALDELAWIEAVARDWPVLRAVVAQAPLELGTAAAPEVAALAARPLVTGVRRIAQDEAPGFLTSPAFVAGVRLLAGHELSFDACVREHQLGELITLVDRCPDVIFLLDHLGKPNVRAGRWSPWQAELARLAKRENVHAKLSGLTTEADWEAWQPSDVRRYLLHALDVFGPLRCLYGSDWPVATLAARPEQWWDVVSDALSELPGEQYDAVMGGNAARLYRISGVGHTAGDVT